MTTGDFLLKFQDPVSFNNLVLYFETDKLDFNTFKQEVIWKEGILKYKRMYQTIKFFLGYVFWIPTSNKESALD